jgi:hypothetical protein
MNVSPPIVRFELAVCGNVSESISMENRLCSCLVSFLAYSMEICADQQKRNFLEVFHL